MLGRVAACGAAAAIMLPLIVTPVSSSAKGFVGHSVPHGAFTHNQFLHRENFGRRNPRHFNFGRYTKHRGIYPYDYAFLPLGYDAPVIPDEVVVPVPYPIVPRCVHSVESVLVPAESGGLRRITITRC